ncbi:hypothetical protein [Xenorhabdus mauleonii]
MAAQGGFTQLFDIYSYIFLGKVIPVFALFTFSNVKVFTFFLEGVWYR